MKCQITLYSIALKKQGFLEVAIPDKKEMQCDLWNSIIKCKPVKMSSSVNMAPNSNCIWFWRNRWTLPS